MIHWKDSCWSSNTLATWCEEPTRWKRPWCWERLKVGGEGDDRGWDSWVASPTQWTWVWVKSGWWWWTGRSGVLQSMGLQRVGHNWATELNWTDNVVPFTYFAFVTFCQNQKIITKTYVKSLLPIFSSRSLMILGLEFKSLIHFELVIVHCVS